MARKLKFFEIRQVKLYLIESEKVMLHLHQWVHFIPGHISQNDVSGWPAKLLPTSKYTASATIVPHSHFPGRKIKQFIWVCGFFIMPHESKGGGMTTQRFFFKKKTKTKTFPQVYSYGEPTKRKSQVCWLCSADHTTSSMQQPCSTGWVTQSCWSSSSHFSTPAWQNRSQSKRAGLACHCHLDAHYNTFKTKLSHQQKLSD